MRIARALAATGFIALGLAANAAAADRKAPAPIPGAVQRLLQCRTLASAEQRLACFDRETGAIQNDIARRDLVVVDRGQMNSTRRTLFGLVLPRIDILGDSDADEIKQIESTIASFGNNREGSALFTLADGTRWSQTDSTTLDIPPNRGEKVTVKRGALGSYVLLIRGEPPVKVKRVQ